MVVAMCSKKFGRKQELKSVVKPQQGLSAEREYKRLAKEVNNEMFEVIKENMPLIIDIFITAGEIGYVTTAGAKEDGAIKINAKFLGGKGTEGAAPIELYPNKERR